MVSPGHTEQPPAVRGVIRPDTGQRGQFWPIWPPHSPDNSLCCNTWPIREPYWHLVANEKPGFQSPVKGKVNIQFAINTQVLAEPLSGCHRPSDQHSVRYCLNFFCRLRPSPSVQPSLPPPLTSVAGCLNYRRFFHFEKSEANFSQTVFKV